MDDMISRQAAIDVIEAGRLTKLIDAETAVNGLKALPPMPPKEPCSICKNLYSGDTLGGKGFEFIYNIKFCPVCGRELKNE